MQPERIQGKSHGYDSDIWSLALALVECALGYFPYRDQVDPAQVQAAAQQQDKQDSNSADREAGEEDGKQQATGSVLAAAGKRRSRMGFWDIMERIVSLPPPQLPKSSFSAEFCSFVQQWYCDPPDACVHAVCIAAVYRKTPVSAPPHSHYW